MSRLYDSHTTTFSPDGRLFQVEYALKAIEHAGAAIAILATDGVIIAAERKSQSKLLDKEVTLLNNIAGEKFARIDDHIAVGIAGLTSDAYILVDMLRLRAARYRFQYGESIPVEQLVQYVCDVKQSSTHHGGLRPYGVSFLFLGWDAYHGFQLYHSDPSGNYAAWKANAIGGNSTAALSLLKQQWNESLDVKTGLKLGISVMAKMVDATEISAEKVEFAVLTRGSFEVIAPGKLRALIEEVKAEKAKDQP